MPQVLQSPRQTKRFCCPRHGGLRYALQRAYHEHAPTPHGPSARVQGSLLRRSTTVTHAPGPSDASRTTSRRARLCCPRSSLPLTQSRDRHRDRDRGSPARRHDHLPDEPPAGCVQAHS